AGFDLGGARAESTDGSSAWYVTFTPALGGLPVLGGGWSVAIGSQGRILSASGRLADPVAVGDYPLVGVTTGVRRLREGWKWIIYSGPVPMAPADTPVPESSAAPATAVSPPTSAAAQGVPATPPCSPGEPCPAVTAPEPSIPPVTAAPRIVTVTGVHLALAWAWPAGSANAEAWLVPVYVVELSGGAAYPFLGDGVPVLAVADRYATPSPSTTSPPQATEPGANRSRP
ncbi:MAG TPA: hypothetical protein VKQ71_01295, partial [Acidimicrobiales bacterium]|nr:hypothetical protein [Acidimicrobiales bacterium]